MYIKSKLLIYYINLNMTYDDIKSIANEQYNSAGGLIPVPVVDIAKKLGLAIYEIDMPKIEGVVPSGALIPNTIKDDEGKIIPNGWTILINEKETHTRKRFTIAHEIGHFLIHKDKAFIDNFSSGEIFYRTGNSIQEKEANYFAANLLMPEDKVKEIWKLSSGPAEMADKFDVSEISMTFRLTNLNLIDVSSSE